MLTVIYQCFTLFLWANHIWKNSARQHVLVLGWPLALIMWSVTSSSRHTSGCHRKTTKTVSPFSNINTGTDGALQTLEVKVIGVGWLEWANWFGGNLLQNVTTRHDTRDWVQQDGPDQPHTTPCSWSVLSKTLKLWDFLLQERKLEDNYFDCFYH